MKIELNSAVHSDLLEIMEYYEMSAGDEVASDFYIEFRYYADQAAQRPESFPTYSKQIRRANLSRFPYHFLFRSVDEHTIRILVVRHDRRHPSYGTRRR